MGLFSRKTKPMDEDGFWALIELLEGRTDDEALERLRGGIGSRRDAVAFQERLALVLFDLDREVIAQQRVRFDDMRPDDEPMPLSDDSFLYLRAGVVSRGREAVAEVIADPSTVARGSWPDFEDLLYVAEEVAGNDIETAVSYETGSNDAHWSPRPDVEEGDLRPRPAILECRDMSEPIEGVSFDQDGTERPLVMHLPPGYLSWDDMHAVTDALSTTIDDAGGLPAELDADMLIAVIEIGEEHDLDPELRDVRPGRIDETIIEREVAVRVTSHEVRAWPRDQRRRALHALAASALLAVLPHDHAARGQLEQAEADGRDLVED